MTLRYKNNVINLYIFIRTCWFHSHT